MIVSEYLNDGTLIKHYSDKGVLLLQNETGIMYSDPVDIVPCPYTYTETDVPIEQPEHVEDLLADAVTALETLGYREVENG